MTKTLLPLFLTLVLSLFLSPKSVYSASNLEVSADSNFSNQTTSFSAGQTVWVKVAADNNGDSKHVLNLRDNQYNQIASYDLSKNGNEFTANFPAPSNEGYYSLEAQIESSGSKSTSVKTIKVGKPSDANLKVNIHTKVEGQSVTGSQNNTRQSPSYKSSPSPIISPTPSLSPESEVLSTTDYTLDQNKKSDQPNFFSTLGEFFKKIISFVWPFN